MKLITEVCDDITYNLIEESTGQKSYFIEGTYMQAGKKNHNGRLYPVHVMERQVDEYQKLIKEKRSLSELGHPSNPQINLDKVSHLITELKMKGNDVCGKAKILKTPMGRIAENLLSEGIKLGVSSRGLGSLVSKDGIKIVQEDFKLMAIDIVAEPSGPDCWVQGIMESAEWVYNASTDSWAMAEQFKEQYKRMKVAQINEAKLKDFEHFLNSLK